MDQQICLSLEVFGQNTFFELAKVYYGKKNFFEENFIDSLNIVFFKFFFLSKLCRQQLELL